MLRQHEETITMDVLYATPITQHVGSAESGRQLCLGWMRAWKVVGGAGPPLTRATMVDMDQSTPSIDAR